MHVGETVCVEGLCAWECAWGDYVHEGTMCMRGLCTWGAACMHGGCVHDRGGLCAYRRNCVHVEEAFFPRI